MLWDDGPMFAEFNIGSTINSYENVTTYDIENVGGYYEWGGAVNKDTRTVSNTSYYSLDEDDIQYLGLVGSKTVGDTAKLVWGAYWKMPTKSDMEALFDSDNTDWEWCDGNTKQYETGCTISGWKVSGKAGTEFESNSLFLPAAGYFNNSNVSDLKTNGLYWTSTHSSGDTPDLVTFDNDEQAMDALQPWYGCSVRAIYYPEGCFAKGTKITMADGFTKNIEDIKEGDKVLTFNHESGCFEAQEVYYAFKSSSIANAFTLNFEDGTKLSIVGLHDLFEKEALRYVSLTESNANSFVGKHFYSAKSGKFVKLVSVNYESESTEFYSLYTKYNLNCIAEGLLSVPTDVDYLLNIYDFDENLKADANTLASDIAKYGLFENTADFNISADEFDYQRNKYLNIAIGKGLVTMEKLWSLHNQYMNDK